MGCVNKNKSLLTEGVITYQRPKSMLALVPNDYLSIDRMSGDLAGDLKESMLLDELHRSDFPMTLVAIMLALMPKRFIQLSQVYAD